MQSTDHFSYDEYDRLTRAYVDQRGDLNYPGLKKDLAALKDFIDQLAAVSPENKAEWFPGDDERKRYYLTAYRENELEEAARSFINDPANVRFDESSLTQ